MAFEFECSLPTTDVLYRAPRNLGVIETPGTHMVYRERMLLYSLVFGLAPERCLEIGVAQGGSSRIIHGALSTLNKGRLVSVDPFPQLNFDWSQISDRATLLVGFSPAALSEAKKIAGGDFDFVFVDGDHSHKAVKEDLVALLEVTHPGTVVLLHDTFHPPTGGAIDSVVDFVGGYSDGGIICNTYVPGIEFGGVPTSYGGLRLLTRVPHHKNSLWRIVGNWTSLVSRLRWHRAHRNARRAVEKQLSLTQNNKNQ